MRFSRAQIARWSERSKSKIRSTFPKFWKNLDLKAEDSNGRKYDIEMQTVNKVAFINRILYYWSKIYADQIRAGESYVNLKPVVSIILTRFDLLKELPDLHNVFGIRAEKKPDFILTDDLQIHTLELTPQKWGRFMKDPDLEAAQKLPQNWTDFFLNANCKSEEEMENLILATPGLDVAYDKFQEFTQDDELRELAFAREKAERDREAELLYAQTAGLEKGRREGIREGRLKGIREGVREGREKGIQEGLVQGQEKGKAEMLIENIQNILDFRFGKSVSAELKTQFESLTDIPELQELFAFTLSAERLEDICEKVHGLR